MRHSRMQSQQLRTLVLLVVSAYSAHTARAQLPPLQPFEPLQPLQPFRPMAPLPGFAPFPPMPQMQQMPHFPGFGQPFAGAAAGATAGRAAGPGTYTVSSSSSSFAGPRASTTPGCTVVQESSGESQGSSRAGSSSCSLSQRIEVCQGSRPGSLGLTKAVATINGQQASCCVVLLKLPAKTPQLFCSAPNRGAGYSRLPAANTAVELKPECSSDAAEGTAGSLSCTVTFTQLPEGYTYPEGHTAASPLVLYRGSRGAATAAAAAAAAGSTPSVNIGGAPGSSSAGGSAPGSRASGGFLPCNNKRFRKFMQAVSRTLPNGGVVLTSKCD